MTDQHQPESCGQLYTRQTQTAEELGTGYSGQLYTVQNTQRKLGVWTVVQLPLYVYDVWVYA